MTRARRGPTQRHIWRRARAATIARAALDRTYGLLSNTVAALPFLFIGLIAVVRRVLVIPAETEFGVDREVTDFAIEIGALAGLALVLAVAIHLLRASSARQP